jgi:hypothetical protein
MTEISRRNFLYQAGLLTSASLISLDIFAKAPNLKLAYSAITGGFGCHERYCLSGLQGRTIAC